MATPAHREPTIAVMGGGGFQMDADDDRLDRWLLGLTARTAPRVCLLPTASGDRPGLIEKFEATFARYACTPSVLRLFQRDGRDLRQHLLAQDLIYVTGGNTANMLAIWRVHGVDAILRDAWRAGVVLAGLSAGSLCWFESGVTDAFGPELDVVEGLGLVPGSHCPHYDGEVRRRPTYRRLVGSGRLPTGLALDDHAAALYVGEPPQRTALVSARPDAGAYRVSFDGRAVHEVPLTVEQL